MDGSEPGEVLPAAVLSGAPVDLQARTVRYVFLHVFEALLIYAGYIATRRLLHNQVIGTRTIGEWTGTYCREGIVGRIH